MKLSILITSLNSREVLLKRLLNELDKQICTNNLQDLVEVLTNIDSGELSIGYKRNELKSRAKGEYICYIDDDDLVCDTYLKDIFNVINYNHDIITFFVEKYDNGEKSETLILPNPSIDGMEIGNIHFWINMLHICPHKREISNYVNFPDIDNWEDLEYSRQIKNLCLNQHRIEKILYYYYKN